MPAVTFYLGTHEPHWLRFSTVPLFLSAIRLRRRPPKHKATCRYAIDLGGYSALNSTGRWQTTPEQEIESVRRWAEALGPPDWVTIQDWMCEPHVIEKTGLSIAQHQRLTVESWITLTTVAPDLPWIPVLQGFHHVDYFAHVDLYKRLAGYDPRTAPTCGIGTVCRRQDTAEAERIIADLHAEGFSNLHGFGFKIGGLARVASLLKSADSLAWSDRARRAKIRLEGCRHLCCSSCWRWASQWRNKVMDSISWNVMKKPEPTLFPL